LYRRVIFGRLTKDDLRNILDLSPREWTVFVPLILLTMWMGIYPSSFTSFWDASVGAMVQNHTAALATTSRLAATPPGWQVPSRPATTLQRTTREDAGGRGVPGHDDRGVRL
jgi:hypothetical protein